MLQLKRGTFEVSRQTDVDEARADVPISLYSPREGQITPLTDREPSGNARGEDSFAHVGDEKVILHLCGNIGATGRMSGKGDPGLDILRRRKCLKQPPNLGFDAEFQVNRPETLLTNNSRAHR